MLSFFDSPLEAALLLSRARRAVHGVDTDRFACPRTERSHRHDVSAPRKQPLLNLLFGRFGWNEGQNESFAYTEVDQTVEAGAGYSGTRWRRPVDKIGLAVVTNAIKRDHQNYLKNGGLGFLLGDSDLNYGRESIVESYYNYHAWRGMFYAVDVQHINNPGYNRDRGSVWVGSVRAHVDF